VPVPLLVIELTLNVAVVLVPLDAMFWLMGCVPMEGGGFTYKLAGELHTVVDPVTRVLVAQTWNCQPFCDATLAAVVIEVHEVVPVPAL